MISDFGLAGMDVTSTNLPEAGIAGTPAYMAPSWLRQPSTDEPQMILLPVVVFHPTFTLLVQLFGLLDWVFTML